MALLAPAERALGDELVQPAEMLTKAQWVSHELLSSDRPVLSFVLDGKPSSEVMKGWQESPLETKDLGAGRKQYRRVWTDPNPPEVSIVGVDYGDYPAVEWTAYLKNNGANATPIIDDLRGIDTRFGTRLDAVTLRTTQGDNYSAGGYAPLEFKLSEKAVSFQLRWRAADQWGMAVASTSIMARKGSSLRWVGAGPVAGSILQRARMACRCARDRNQRICAFFREKRSERH